MIRILLPESAMRPPQAPPLNPANTWEWTTPSRAQASMVDGQLGHHRHVQGDPVARLEAEVSRSTAANSFTRR